MKSRIFCWLLLVFFTALCLLSAELFLSQQALAEKTLRLHVVANSDSAADQAQKLRVRDAVVATVSDLLAGCTSAADARIRMAEHLPEIQDAAEAQLRQEGSAYAVTVRLVREEFPTRVYDTFTLPAGNYPALRVQIGAAAGKNWWCVVFPSLCTAATAELLEEAACAGGFDSAETELITGGPETYELRFQALEWLQSLLNWLS